ncbi:hypothetical protein ACJMK2_008295 [Sinanodonta woodiana]|uniref:Poly [ADP-ribose] polymerase 12-like n=1 Tax=Sinanodonta woodiana TaxID=1069815 RepID=A0ABD3VLE1_SINWO
MAFSKDSSPHPEFMQQQLRVPATSGKLDLYEEIARHVLKILCSEQRSVPLKEILDELCNHSINGLTNGRLISALDMSQLNEILNSYPDHFILTAITQHQLEVKPHTIIEFCKIHCAKNGHCPGRPIVPCNGLHICKYYIFDTCTFENNCKYGHDLRTEHNMQVRRNYLLDQLKGQEIKYLLNLAESRSEMTVPRICKFYNNEGGCRYQKHRKLCPHLHICKHYVMDRCNFGKRCKRNHDIFAPDVKETLTRYKINISRTPREIIAELRDALSRDEVETNEVSYQRPRLGQHFASKWAMSTPNLAMQNLSFRTPPDFSDRDSDDSSSNSVKGATGGTRRKSPRSMSTSNLAVQNVSLPPLLVYYESDSDESYSNEGASGGVQRNSSRPMFTPDHYMQKPSVWSQSGPSYNDSGEESSSNTEGARRKPSASGRLQSWSNVNNASHRFLSANSTQEKLICLYNLRGRCQYGQTCRNEHKNMPYQWQIQYPSDGVWEDFDQSNNWDIEFSFCNPNCDDCDCEDRGGQRVHIFFEKMEGKTHDKRKLKIRRLSTVSCVKGSQPLATRWHWFWKDKRGNWVEYGTKNMTGYQTNIGSDVIEKKYLENPKGQCQFETRGHEYILDFKTMLQQNMATNSTCKVKRRPEHCTSSQD